MDHIDVRDLSEEETRLLAAFVEFLRRRKQEAAQQEEAVPFTQTIKSTLSFLSSF